MVVIRALASQPRPAPGPFSRVEPDGTVRGRRQAQTTGTLDQGHHVHAQVRRRVPPSVSLVGSLVTIDRRTSLVVRCFGLGVDSGLMGEKLGCPVPVVVKTEDNAVNG